MPFVAFVANVALITKYLKAINLYIVLQKPVTMIQVLQPAWLRRLECSINHVVALQTAFWAIFSYRLDRMALGLHKKTQIGRCFLGYGKFEQTDFV